MATRNGSAEWNGSLKDGKGSVTVGDDVFTGAFSFHSRFEDGSGTNPEELVAAANAACFSMALSGILGEDGHEPEYIRTKARAQLRNVDGRPTITQMAIETEGKVPGIDEAAFTDAAEKAKAGCVISRALGGVDEITLTATLAT
jgi:osmotically inducible protein OsmC